VFQFPLAWNETPLKERWYARSSTFVPKQGHLQRIRNLVAEVYLFWDATTRTTAHDLPRPVKAVKKEPQHAIGHEHRLRKVEISFNNIKTEGSPNEVLAEWLPLVHHKQTFLGPRYGGCCFDGPLDLHSGFRRSALNNAEMEVLCRQAVEVDQRVLKGLASVRGKFPNSWSSVPSY
jgi:hypothetical protein